MTTLIAKIFSFTVTAASIAMVGIAAWVLVSGFVPLTKYFCW